MSLSIEDLERLKLEHERASEELKAERERLESTPADVFKIGNNIGGHSHGGSPVS